MHRFHKPASFVQNHYTLYTCRCPRRKHVSTREGSRNLTCAIVGRRLKGLVQIGLDLCTIHAGILDKQC